MTYYESGAMAREQKLERLKEIENVLIECKGCFEIGGEAKLKYEANKIGEEFKSGCGESFDVLYGTNGEVSPRNCGDKEPHFEHGFCPTCKEIKERVARINNG